MQISSCVSPNYMDHQSDINEKMRAILIDWLIEVEQKRELYLFAFRKDLIFLEITSLVFENENMN